LNYDPGEAEMQMRAGMARVSPALLSVHVRRRESPALAALPDFVLMRDTGGADCSGRPAPARAAPRPQSRTLPVLVLGRPLGVAIVAAHRPARRVVAGNFF
jgi:hypothetical protein